MRDGWGPIVSYRHIQTEGETERHRGREEQGQKGDRGMGTSVGVGFSRNIIPLLIFYI